MGLKGQVGPRELWDTPQNTHQSYPTEGQGSRAVSSINFHHWFRDAAGARKRAIDALKFLDNPVHSSGDSRSLGQSPSLALDVVWPTETRTVSAKEVWVGQWQSLLHKCPEHSLVKGNCSFHTWCPLGHAFLDKNLQRQELNFGLSFLKVPCLFSCSF